MRWAKSLFFLLFFWVLMPMCIRIGYAMPQSVEQAVSEEEKNNPDKEATAEEEENNAAETEEEETEEEGGVKISKNALDDIVTTHAEDSMILHIKDNKFYLYEKAQANYQDIEVRSGILIYDQSNNTLTAVPYVDSTGKITSQQEFQQSEELIAYDSLKYNFISQRALVLNARTQHGEGFIHSEKVKRNKDGTTFGAGNIYTTCNLPHPHFGIHAKKIKVIPNKMIASGPANLTIQDVPTPLFAPFGIFPVTQGKSSGFILPTYGVEERKGIGLQGIGYYFAINDYLGMTNTFDIYSKGSWATYNSIEYSKRYAFAGRLSINYAQTKYGETYDYDGSLSKDFRVQWNHGIDTRATPGSTFSASVNFGTSSYDKLNSYYDVNQALNNQYSSSISYSKNWNNKPFSLSAAMRHNQSTQTGLVMVTAPDVNFSVNQFSPFQRKNMVGKAKWYEKIMLSYAFDFQNQIQFYDSLVMDEGLNIDNFNYGAKHTVRLQANYNLWRYVNWSISMPYNEYWNTKQLYTYYNPQESVTDSTINHGFYATRDFSLSTSLNTRIYGMKMFKPGKKIMGIRHVISPSLSFNFTPGFALAPFEYMYENQWDPNQNPHYESPYRLSPVGSPNNALPRGNIGLNIGNTLQLKVAGSDSTEKSKNISLIDALGMNFNYNAFADSMNLSMINLNFRTNVGNNFSIHANTVLDPYVYDENNRQTSKYKWDAGEGFLGFRSANIGFSLNLAGRQRKERSLDSLSAEQEALALLFANNGIQQYHDFEIPWSFGMSGGLGIFKLFDQTTKEYRLRYSPNLMFNGSFNLTDRWKVAASGGLEFTEFKEIRMGTTSFNISRDLHCWQMSLSLVPWGYYRSFHFNINVKASVLQDLKLTRRRTFHDNY